MNVLDSALRELQGLVDREASMIASECRDAVAKGLPPSVAHARADAALAELWGWEKYLRQRIGNEHGTGLPPGPVNPEPRSKPFRRAMGVTLGDLAAGQSLVDELGAAIGDLATIAILRQLLSLPRLDGELRQREKVSDLAERLPRDLVPDDQVSSEGGATTAARKRPPAPAPGRSRSKSA